MNIAFEDTVKVCSRFKSAFIGDLVDRFVGVCEKKAGMLYLKAVDVMNDSLTCVFLKEITQISL